MFVDCSRWLDRRVILTIDTGVSQFPLRGPVVAVSGDSPLLRIAHIFDVHVPTQLRELPH
jgi:hypothetical protein